jgi:hypothetical protein
LYTFILNSSRDLQLTDLLMKRIVELCTQPVLEKMSIGKLGALAKVVRNEILIGGKQDLADFE